eukprot:11861543-Prorocentrum_lima.AAC.1
MKQLEHMLLKKKISCRSCPNQSRQSGNSSKSNRTRQTIQDTVNKRGFDPIPDVEHVANLQAKEELQK